jgi:hypothetical protein
MGAKTLLVSSVGATVLAVAGCQPPQYVSIRDEVAFLDAILAAEFEDAVTSRKPLWIKETTSITELYSEGEYEAFKEGLIAGAGSADAGVAEAVKDFCSRNAKDSTISPDRAPTLKHVLLLKEEFDRIFDLERQGGWGLFYEKYPDATGIITLSRPGFGLDGNTAVIYMAFAWDWLGAYGNIYVYRKQNGKWSRYQLWHSWVS